MASRPDRKGWRALPGRLNIEKLADGTYACRVDGCTKTFNSQPRASCHRTAHPEIQGKVHIYTTPSPEEEAERRNRRQAHATEERRRYEARKRAKLRHKDVSDPPVAVALVCPGSPQGDEEQEEDLVDEIVPALICRCHFHAGSGRTLIPGNFDPSMRESFRVAATWAMLNYARIVRALGLSKGGNSVLLTAKQDMSLSVSHLDSGKEGPSMSAAMVLAILASRLGCELNKGIAVTADLNLRGQLCPVGGLEEKARSALKAGDIRKIIIPASNYDKMDLNKLPEDIRVFCCSAFVRAEHMGQVLSLCLPGFPSEEQQEWAFVPATVFPQGGGRPIHVECCLTPVGTGEVYTTGNLHNKIREAIGVARAYVAAHGPSIASALGGRVKQKLTAFDRDLHVHMPWFWRAQEVEDVAGAISAALVALIMGKQIPPGWGFWASVQSNGALLPVASLEPYYVDMMKVARVERLVVETSVLGMPGAEIFAQRGIELVGASTLVQALRRVWGLACG